MAGFWLLFSSHLSLKWSLFTESGDEYQKSVKKRNWTIEQNLWKMCRLPLNIVQTLNEKLFSMFLSSFNFSSANTRLYSRWITVQWNICTCIQYNLHISTWYNKSIIWDVLYLLIFWTLYKTNTLRNLTAGDELVVHELVHVLSNEQDNYKHCTLSITFISDNPYILRSCVFRDYNAEKNELL